MTKQIATPVDTAHDDQPHDPALTEFTDKRSGIVIIIAFFVTLTLLGLIEFVRHFYLHG